jgi:hypothetical protein
MAIRRDDNKYTRLSLQQYDGQARNGEIVIDLDTYTVWVGDASGALLPVGGGNTANATIGNLIVTGTSNLGDIANITILGGTPGSVLSTDGAGNLVWSPATPTTYGNANVEVLLASGNIATDIITTANANVGNFNLAGIANLGSNLNVRITGGNSGEVLTTDGTGNLSWSVGGSTTAVVPAIYFTATSTGNNQTFSNIYIAAYTSNTDITLFYNGALLDSDFYTLSGDTITVTTPVNAGDSIDIIRTAIANANAISGYGNTEANAFLAAGLVGNIIPDGDAVYSLGNSTNQWKDLWVSNSTIYFNTVPLTANSTTLTFAGEPLLVNNGSSNITTTGVIETGGLVSNGNVVAETGYFFLGDGGLLSNISGTGTYSNANVANYLPTYTGNLDSVDAITTSGNITANVGAFFLGDGGLLSNVASAYGNAEVANYLPTYTGNLGNVDSITAANLEVTGSANLGSNATVTLTGGTNGQYLQTDGSGGLSWADAVSSFIPAIYFPVVSAGNNQTFSNSFLASYTSNTDITLFYNGILLESTYYTLAGDTITVNTTLAIGDSIDLIQTAAGNVNVITGTYANSNVEAYLNSGQMSDIIPSGNAVYSLGNLTNQWKDLWVSNATIYFNTVPLAANATTLTFAGEPILVSGGNSNIATTGSLEVGNVTATGNITANTGYFFVGDGGFLSNVGGGGSYGNADVALYLPTYTGNLGNVDSITATGNITVGTGAFFVGDGGLLSNISGGGGYSNADVSTYLSSGTDTAGIVTTGNVTANRIAATTFSGDGGLITNITGGYVIGDVANAAYSVLAGSAATVYDNAQPNITSVGTLIDLTSAGNITAQAGSFFLGDGGLLSNVGGTGNAAGANTQIQFNDSNAFNGSANFTFTNTGSGLVTIGGELSLSGNGTIGTLGSNLLLQPAGNAIVEVAGRQWTYDLSGNLTVPGNIQSITTGGFTSNIIGIDTGNPTVIVSLADLIFGPGDAGQVTISGVVGTTEANGTWYFQATDVDRFELYTDDTFTTPVDGSTWTAYVSGGAAVSAGNYTNLTITGGNVIIGANTLVANGNVIAAGNITAQAGSFFIGDGGLLSNISTGTVYSNANVANYLPTYTGNLGNVDSITTTGNITVGTGSFIIADGTYLTNVPGASAEGAFTIETASFSAVSGVRYGVDTTGGAVTATLPDFPATGQAIFFADAGGAYATNNLTVSPNGLTIMGDGSDLTVNTPNQNFGLFWNGTTWRTY